MKEIQLDEVFEFIRNGASIKQADGKGGYPISRIETIWNKTIDTKRLGYADIGDEQLKDYEKYLMKEGDILMTHINSPKHLGKCAVYTGDPKTLIHGMNLLCMRANQQITIPTYIKYFFNSKFFKVQLPKISNQSVNQASFSAGNLKKLKIPLPPLDQQKKIAAILDAADAYKQKTKALIEKYDELTQSLFLDMFGDPVTNPKGWEIKTLNDVCSKITDGEHGTVKRLNSGKLYLMARNVGHHSIVLDEVSYISQEDHERIYKRCNPETGDLLLVCVGATIGRCCLVPFDFDEFSLARSVALIKPNIQFNSLFLLHHFKDLHFQNEIQNSRNTSAQAGLYTGQIKKLKVSVPPIELQNQYAERVQVIEAQKVQAQASLAQAEDLFNSLLQKAFKGELV